MLRVTPKGQRGKGPCDGWKKPLRPETKRRLGDTVPRANTSGSHLGGDEAEGWTRANHTGLCKYRKGYKQRS